jgi:hypothetical protein
METVSLLYWLSFYKISKKVIFKIDKLRKIFFLFEENYVRKKVCFYSMKNYLSKQKEVPKFASKVVI